MSVLNEDALEQLAITLLQQQGYDYVHASTIAPGEAAAERNSFADVLLLARLRAAVQRINPSVAVAAQADAIKEVERVYSPDLSANNEQFHRLLTTGVPVSTVVDGNERGERVWLIDFDHPENNEFVVMNQFTVIENGNNKRPDLVLFVNGIPLVVMELKNPAAEKATVRSAFDQLQTYKATIPCLFAYNAFMIVSDGLEAKAGTVSSAWERFAAWHTAHHGQSESDKEIQLETLIRAMLEKATLLDIIRHFIMFEKSDAQATKKMAAYHQYYAVNRAVESTLRAASAASAAAALTLQEPPATYGLPSVEKQPAGDKKGGVVWHTQGSGKSLTMVFFTGKIVLALNNPTILLITDRNDLDDQLFDTFAASAQLLRQPPRRAENREHLKELLRVASGGVVFSTIQKFHPNEGNVYECLSERNNIVVIADEAHRTQYGFSAKIRDVTSEHGDIVGQEIHYGFAKYMRDALPNATYLGFTGTPIEKTDVNTPKVFGDYVDVYDIAQAVKDGATVPIYYESRLAKVGLSEDGRQLVAEYDAEHNTAEEDEAPFATQQIKAKWTRLEALIGNTDRIKNIAKDVVAHFEQRQQALKGKGMMVCMSRRIAALFYDAVINIRPNWASDELDKGQIKVVMTSSSADGPQIAKHHTTKEQRKRLATRMKDPDDPLMLTVVCDMWLTGFDVPSLHTLYLDKLVRGHSLMQAIARVNRVYKDKNGGLVVDYLGVAAALQQALSFYSNAGGRGEAAAAQESAVKLMLEKLEVVAQMFHGFAYQEYFTADTARKLAIILDAENFILKTEELKKRFINQVAALSKAFAISVPHEEAMAVKQQVAFFHAVKARLVKFSAASSEHGGEEAETAVRQVIDEALVSDKVVDIYDAAGIKKPDISILSEEFMLKLKNMRHKNIALEVLKKILNDEIRARAKINLVRSRSLMEMLDGAITRYQNKVLTAAEVIDELIKLSREIVGMDGEAAGLELSDNEYAFYSAVADNASAMELMGKDRLRELAVELTEQVRKNASIDWTLKESARAKLKVMVKRMLKKYGYPPDMAQLATETVLKQAEMLANSLTAA